MLIKIIINVARFLLKIIARVDKRNFDALPDQGGVIVVSNHLGRLDAILAYLVLKKRDDIIIMIAEKYRSYALWRWLAKQLDALWLNRYDADFSALREVIRRLRQGEVLAISPEGTRSKSETLASGKLGAAYLAAKTKLPVVPVALMGTEDRVVKERLKRFQRLDIKIYLGDPFYLPPMERENRDAYLHAQTDEIMCRIAVMLEPKYRGVYTDHTRLHELLKIMGNKAGEFRA